jgi:ketosteroid isomerase-like protein
MSEENVEVVERAFDAFSAGGVEACMPWFSPDVVVYPFPEWPQQTEYRGHDGLRAVLAEWMDNFDNFGFHVHEVREVGDRVLMLGETFGRIKGSAVPIRQPLGAVYSNFRDGQIGEGRNFLTWDEALEAAGLSE